VGLLEEIREKKPQRKFIIKSKKTVHKGYLFGHISNGGGIVDIGEGFALKFTATEKFVTIELLDFGKYDKVETQTWYKGKSKETTQKIVIEDEDVDTQTLFDL